MFKAFLSLSGLTLLSRLSGFIKVAAMAAFYGRTLEADIFMAVMLIPDLLYKFISEGVVSCSAVPIFTERSNDREALNSSFWSLNLISACAGFAIFLFLAFFSSSLCSFALPGFNAENSERICFMWSVSALYVVLSLPAAVMTSFLNSELEFALPAVAPLIVNFSIILGIFVANGGAIEIIIYSNLIGAFLQLLWLFWLIIRTNLIDFSIKKLFVCDKNVTAEFLKGSAPIGIWVLSLAFVPVYERYLLSMQTTGALAALNYSEKLFNLPLGIISISLANVILPKLARLEEGKEQKKQVFKFLGYSFFSIVPIIAFIWLFSDYIVEFVYKRGKFSDEDCSFASALFKSYSLALLPVTLNMVLNRGFFAAKKYFKPFVAGIAATAFLFAFGSYGINVWGVPGIGYISSTAYFMQTIFLLLFTVL